MYTSNCDFNYARKCAFNAFNDTLDMCYKEEGITEKSFSELWLNNMKKYDGIIAEGWYNPPPKGIAVLAGSPEYPSRVSFDSLRNKEFWPSDDNIINWDNDVLYFYCSPLDKVKGIPGDLTITLYFGNDCEIRKYFKNTFRVTNEILKVLPNIEKSYDLFCIANKILEENRMVGCGISCTDPALTNFGHTFPCIDMQNTNIITEEQIKTISQSRKFINNTTNWEFECNQQFTFEPQLRLIDNMKLPQISYHYLVDKLDDEIVICDDVNSLLERFDLC